MIELVRHLLVGKIVVLRPWSVFTAVKRVYFANEAFNYCFEKKTTKKVENMHKSHQTQNSVVNKTVTNQKYFPTIRMKTANFQTIRWSISLTDTFQTNRHFIVVERRPAVRSETKWTFHMTAMETKIRRRLQSEHWTLNEANSSKEKVKRNYNTKTENRSCSQMQSDFFFTLSNIKSLTKCNHLNCLKRVQVCWNWTNRKKKNELKRIEQILSEKIWTKMECEYRQCWPFIN